MINISREEARVITNIRKNANIFSIISLSDLLYDATVKDPSSKCMSSIFAKQSMFSKGQSRQIIQMGFAPSQLMQWQWKSNIAKVKQRLEWWRTISFHSDSPEIFFSWIFPRYSLSLYPCFQILENLCSLGLSRDKFFLLYTNQQFSQIWKESFHSAHPSEQQLFSTGQGHWASFWKIALIEKQLFS